MSKTNKILFVVSGILVALSLYLSIQISHAVPQFEKLFEGFGTEINDNTKFILKYHHSGLILPIAALITFVYFIKFKTNQFLKNIFYTFSVVTFVITLNFQAYTAEAMYAPVMNMKTK